MTIKQLSATDFNITTEISRSDSDQNNQMQRLPNRPIANANSPTSTYERYNSSDAMSWAFKNSFDSR